MILIDPSRRYVVGHTGMYACIHRIFTDVILADFRAKTVDLPIGTQTMPKCIRNKLSEIRMVARCGFHGFF